MRPFTKAEARAHPVAKTWRTPVEKFNPYHVESGPQGGQFTSGPDSGEIAQHFRGPEPVKVKSLQEAIDRLSEGKGVEFERPKEAVALVEEIGKRVEAAKASGLKAPTIDLCGVYVAGSIWFCSDAMQIPRSSMPQLGGFPKPGSPGDKLPRDPIYHGVDLVPSFVAKLRAEGITVEDTKVTAGFLRGTQAQINGGKVAAIMHAFDTGTKLPSDHLLVSDENYIVDGHHRWAAEVAYGLEHGKVPEIAVYRVHQPIFKLLARSNSYADEMGIPRAGLAVTKLVEPCGCNKGKRDIVSLSARRKPLTKVWRTPVQKAAGDEEYQQIQNIADQSQVEVARGFLASIHQITDLQDWGEVIRLITDHDLEGVIREIVEQVADTVIDQLTMPFVYDTLQRSGHAFLNKKFIPPPDIEEPQGAEIVMRFDVTNPHTVEAADLFGAELVSEVDDETRAGIRAIVADAMEYGGHPYEQARMIRDLIGLTEAQAKAVASFRQMLEDKDAAALTRALRDQRFDSTLQRALGENPTVSLSTEEISRMVERYAERMLNARADNIARTETMRAANLGQNEAWYQAVQKGLLADDAKRKWLVTPDDRLCIWCEAVPDMNPDGVTLDDDFETPFGPVAFPPLHPQCRCVTYLSDLGTDLNDDEGETAKADIVPGQLYRLVQARRKALAKFDEEKHPRDEHGKWATEGGTTGASSDLSGDTSRLGGDAIAERHVEFAAHYGQGNAAQAEALASDWYTMHPKSHLDAYLRGSLNDGAEKSAWDAVTADTQARLSAEVDGDTLDLYRGIPGQDIVNDVDQAKASGAKYAVIPIHDSQDKTHESVSTTGNRTLAEDYAARRWLRHGGEAASAHTGVVLHLRVPKSEVVFATAHSAFTNPYTKEWNEYVVRTGGSGTIRVPLDDIEIVGRVGKSAFEGKQDGDVTLRGYLDNRLHFVEGAPLPMLKFDPDEPRDPHGEWTNGGGGRTEYRDVEVRALGHEGPSSIAVAVNPTESDVAKMAAHDVFNGVRLIKGRDGNIYAWPSEQGIHSDVLDAMGVKEQRNVGYYKEFGRSPTDSFDRTELHHEGDGTWSVLKDGVLQDVRVTQDEIKQTWFRRAGGITKFIILKFDPDQLRDYHGRWTTAAFASPSITDKTMTGALEDMHGPRHELFVRAGHEIDGELGITGQESDVVGAWADGAENSTMMISPSASEAQMKLSGAMKGWLGEQKQVLVFTRDPRGPHAMYELTVPGSLEATHQALLNAGVPFHTLAASAHGTRVLVADLDGSLAHTVDKFAGDHGVVAERTFGKAEFIGDQEGTGSDAEQRTRAREEYQRIIDASEGTAQHSGRTTGAIWRGIRDRWGAQIAAVRKGVEQWIRSILSQSASPS